MQTESCILSIDEESENIIELRRIASSLPDALPLVFAPYMGSVVQTQVLQGANPVIPVHKSKNIAIVLSIGAPDTIIERHAHDQHEWVGVTKGKMIVEFNGTRNEYKENTVCYIPPKLAHKVYFEEYSEVWAITQPADPGWPAA